MIVFYMYVNWYYFDNHSFFTNNQIIRIEALTLKLNAAPLQQRGKQS